MADHGKHRKARRGPKNKANNIYKEKYGKKFPVRVQLACAAAKDAMRPMLKGRKEILKSYANGWYRNEKGGARPINMTWRFFQVMIPFLAGRFPQSQVTATADPRGLSHFAYTMELALNHLKRENKQGRIYRKLIFESLASMGMLKTILWPKYSVEFEGKRYEAGQPHSESVDFADQRYDPVARDFEELSFYGHQYRLPFQYVADSGLFRNYDKLDYRMNDVYGQDQDRAESLSKTNMDVKSNDIYEYVDLLDVWLPDEQVMITIPVEESQGKKILRTNDSLPENGPFDLLYYNTFPDTVIPIPPAYAFMDLDEALNMHMRRMIDQNERSKKILAYDKDAAADAQNVIDAVDGWSVGVTNIDRMKEIELGGFSSMSMEIANYLRQNTSEQAGNLDSMGGVRSEAGTLGQEQILQGRASQVIDDMKDAVYEMAQNADGKYAYYLWSSPLIKLPLIKEIDGIGKVEVEYSEETKEGDFLDYNFEIMPYSMQRKTPEVSYQKLLGLVSQIVLPLAPLAQAQGKEIDVDELLRIFARYMDEPNIERIWIEGVPGAEGQGQQTKPGPYQPLQGQVTMPKKSKNKGQPDGRLKGSDQSSNLSQQQTRASGQSSKKEPAYV